MIENTERDLLPTFFPIVILVASVVLLFFPLLAGRVVFWGLPSLQFYPWYHFAFEQLRNGSPPLWNLLVGAGAPLLANYQSATLYPPNWLHLVWGGPQVMGLIGILHLVWAWVGMWLYTGRLGIGRYGRGISAFAFALSGYMVARFGTFPMVAVAAWMPWIFWAVHETLSRPGFARVATLAGIVAMGALAGHAQNLYYALLGAGFYVIFLMFGGFRAGVIVGDGREVRVGAVVGAVALGLLIAAAQLLPTAELLLQSSRAGGLDEDFILNYSFGPARILTFLSPIFFGTPADGSYLTGGAFWEDAAYIGVLPLGLAVTAVVSWVMLKLRRESHPLMGPTAFFALMALSGLVLATGRYTPLYPFLIRYVPTFAMFQAPSRWLLWTVFGLSILAGIGTLAWGRGKWIFFWSRLIAAGGAGMVAISLAAGHVVEIDSEVLSVLVRAMVSMGVLVGCSALLTLLRPERESGPRWLYWRGLVLLFVAVDLVLAGFGLNPTVDVEFYKPRLIGEGRGYWCADYEYDVRYGRFLRFDDFTYVLGRLDAYRESGLANMNMLDGVELLNNFDPLVTARLREYLDLIEADVAGADTLLRASGVDFVYCESPPNGWPGAEPPFRRPEHSPDAWLVGNAIWVPGQDEAMAVLANRFDPEGEVILEGVPDDYVANDEGNGSVPGQVSVSRSDPTHIIFSVRSGKAAWLVTAFAYYPGWDAFINGEQVELYPANLAFTAVMVPEGVSQVEFIYKPRMFVLGMAISLAALSVWGVMIIFGDRLSDVR